MNDTKAVMGSIAATNAVPTRNKPIISICGHSAPNAESVPVFTLDEEMLSRHMLVLGGTGSGKTTFLKHIIKQLNKNISQNDTIIIFDTKGDFYGNRHKFTMNDNDIFVLSNIETAQTKYWNIFYDLMADFAKGDKPSNESLVTNAFMISSCLFQEMLVKDTHQPFFPIAARDIFMGILVVIMKDYISKKT
ncbi:MAG: ATP-binding protein, partial [Oscillospiraceae bacterium]|nr:ATP-binding protein [Oscillospiraceae bacterium]